MMIRTEVMKRLNSFECSELQRILETASDREYYCCGLRNLNGGYASATAIDIATDSLDDETEADVIEIELESGVQDMGDGYSSCHKSRFLLRRPVLTDQSKTVKDKLNELEEI
jgi:hypothetical protein